VSASYYDASGINTAAVVIKIDGVTLTGCTVAATSVSCPATGLTNGPHTIGGSVADRAGNTTPVSGSFIVQMGTGDVMPPVITNILPSGITNNNSPTISASYSDASSGVDTSTVVVNVDGSDLSGCTVGAASVSCPASGLADGTHTINVNATDNAGNVGLGMGSFDVDATTPTVSNLLPAGNISATSTTISADYGDGTGAGINSATASINLDGTVLSGCTVTATHISCSKSGLIDGTHAYMVSVTDNAGNTGSGSGNFTVDATAPSISGLTPTGIVTTTSPTITAD
jgi:hypothetical protein